MSELQKASILLYLLSYNYQLRWPQRSLYHNTNSMESTYWGNLQQ